MGRNLRTFFGLSANIKNAQRGANFLTPPKQRETEIRCYIRDPDGHLIEVEQTTRARD